MLADGLQPPASGHPLRRDAVVDRTVVHPKGRPLVSGVGVPGAPGRADGAEGVRPASPLSSCARAVRHIPDASADGPKQVQGLDPVNGDLGVIHG